MPGSSFWVTDAVRTVPPFSVLGGEVGTAEPLLSVMATARSVETTGSLKTRLTDPGESGTAPSNAGSLKSRTGCALAGEAATSIATTPRNATTASRSVRPRQFRRWTVLIMASPSRDYDA